VTESELSALLDAHDVLVRACLEGRLTLIEFAAAYGAFPHSYALEGQASSAEERTMLQRFRSRIAFHVLVSGLMSGVGSEHDPADLVPNVALTRIRALVARYPDFKAEPAQPR
jgi:hypothetical protein